MFYKVKESNLENPWVNLPITAPYILPEDEAILQEYKNCLHGKQKIQCELLPVPVFGCPETADIFVLNANPGFSESNREQHKEIAFVQPYRNSLTHKATRHPYLDPTFQSKHGGKVQSGNDYWMSIFSDLIGMCGIETIASKCMVVNFFPYHSENYPESVKNRLPSQDYSFHLVRQAILDHKEIVVLRRMESKRKDKLTWGSEVPELRGKCVVHPYPAFRPRLLRGWIPEHFDRLVERICGSDKQERS